MVDNPSERQLPKHRRRSRITRLLLVMSAAGLAACGSEGGTPAASAYPQDSVLRLNQIQVLGTHNSYHIQPQPDLFTALERLSPPLASTLAYTHIPLDQQFASQGIRQVEIDVFADPNGGLYASRLGLALIGLDPNSGIPELNQPGFKVFHIQDIDFDSTCTTFVECLHTIKTWSDAHPGHVPIMIQIEAKDDPLPLPGFKIPVQIGAAEFDALDAEIRSVFPARQIITPDEVRGSHATLNEAIRTDGWPTLGKTRGRVLFTLDNEDSKRDAYVAGHPSLSGRILFTSSPAGAPESAFIKLNDPIGDYETIREVVAQGYIVRTRADADTVEARANNTAPRDAALSSGAQFVSTDYPVPTADFGNDYHVVIPEGSPARCNPVSAPPNCTSLDIEDPAQLAR